MIQVDSIRYIWKLIKQLKSTIWVDKFLKVIFGNEKLIIKLNQIKSIMDKDIKFPYIKRKRLLNIKLCFMLLEFN